MDEIAFDSDGLVPCVMQDAGTGEVLTLAYMNADALARTRETGQVHFWSRSRQELWRKGETSGNTMAAARPCATTATPTRWWPWSTPPGPPATPASARASTAATWSRTAEEALPALERTIADRKAGGDTESSYTAKLLADPAFTAEKVREEAEEVTRAAREESDERVAEEAADVLYHLTVLLATRDLGLADAFEVLNGRRR